MSSISSVSEQRPPSRIKELLKDAALSLLLVLAIPVAIVVIGTPVVLFARLLIEIGKRL